MSGVNYFEGQEILAEDIPRKSNDESLEFDKGLLRQNSRLESNNGESYDYSGQECMQCRPSIIALEQEVISKNSHIFKLERELSRVKCELDEERQQNAYFEANESDDEGGNESVPAESNSGRQVSSEELSSLRRKVEELKEELKEKKRELEDKDDDYWTEVKEKEKVLKRLGEAQQERDLLERKLGEAQQQRGTPSSRSRNALDQKILSRLNQTEGSNREMKSKIEELQNTLKEKDRVYKELLSSLEQMEADKSMSEEDLMKFRSEASEKLKSARHDLSSKSEELNQMVTKCKEFEVMLASVKNEHQQQLAAANTERERLSTTVHQLEQSINVETGLKNQFHSKVQELLQEKKDEVAEKDHYKKEVSRLTEEKKKMEFDIQQVCTGFQKEAEEALLSYEQLKEKSEKDSLEIEKLRMYRREAMKNSTDFRLEKEAFEAEREKFMAMNRQLQDELKLRDKSIKGLQDEVLAKQLSAETYKEDFDKESQVKNELGKRIRNLDRELKKEKEANETLCAKMQTLAAKNETLSKSNRDLMEQLNSVAATQCLDAFSDAQ